MDIISNYSVSSRGAIDTNYPPTRDTAAQDSYVSAGAETRTPTNKSSALSGLVAKNQTTKFSADAPVQDDKPPLQSSTDIPVPVDFIDSHTDLLQDAVARDIEQRGGCPRSAEAFARDDIFKMVDKIQKDTGKPMSEADILDLMKTYSSTVKVTEIGLGVDEKTQKSIIEHFEMPTKLDVATEIGRELGVDPKAFMAMTYDQLIDLLEKIRSGQ